jgi:hypothetical protein
MLKMNRKQELIELLNQILSYFEIQAQYGGIEKSIYYYYKKVLDKCSTLDFQGIYTHNWARPYLESNSDWNNPILGTMDKADKLIEYFKEKI